MQPQPESRALHEVRRLDDFHGSAPTSAKAQAESSSGSNLSALARLVVRLLLLACIFVVNHGHIGLVVPAMIVQLYDLGAIERCEHGYCCKGRGRSTARS